MKVLGRLPYPGFLQLQTAVALFLLVACSPGIWPQRVSHRLSSKSDYQRYIDPILSVQDFGIEYFDDGAADATVMFPADGQGAYLQPAQPVIALVKLRSASLPLLIDCLSDGRLTNVWFGGNETTKRMRVPVGYVCLDLLMNMAPGKPTSDPDCADDGLGACMNQDFYFLPDDYYGCWKTECTPRPWVRIVQRSWRKQFLASRLRFRNPYDNFRVDEYKNLETPRK